jgi:hypothetical protein
MISALPITFPVWWVDLDSRRLSVAIRHPSNRGITEVGRAR